MTCCVNNASRYYGVHAAILPGQGHRSRLAPEAVAETGSAVTAGGLAEAGDTRCRRDAGGPAGATREPAGEAGRGSRGAAQYPHQPAVADLLPVDRRRSRGRGDHRLPLGGEGSMAADPVMEPVHPGEILLEEFLKPLAVSQYQLAKEIGVPTPRCGWRGSSARRSGSGSTCRPGMTWSTRRTGSAMPSTGSGRSAQPAEPLGSRQARYSVLLLASLAVERVVDRVH